MKINEYGNIEMTPEEFEELSKFYRKPPDDRTTKWTQDSIKQHKCLVCNQYHPVNMPCPHTMLGP